MKIKLILLIIVLFPTFVFAQFSGLVDIGNGRQIYLECKGSSFPTVILVSGRSDRAEIWKKSTKQGVSVFDAVAEFTHVCAYDRPGTVTITSRETVVPSRSTSVHQPVTPNNGVEDLHALLHAAKIPGPYLLVGHSYGGLIVRLYASTYPDEVAGLVLVDTLTEFLYDGLTPSQQDLWIRLNSNYSSDLERYTIQERTDFVPTFEQMHMAAAMRQIPAVVLTSDQPYDFRALMASGILPSDAPVELGPIIFQAHLNAQKKLARLLSAKHISDTNSGHYIQVEQPQLVIDAIREVVEKIRKEKQ